MICFVALESNSYNKDYPTKVFTQAGLAPACAFVTMYVMHHCQQH